MTIADVRDKCKASLASIPRDLLIILVLILASLASFGLGFLAGRDASFATDEQGSVLVAADAVTSSAATTGNFVASKSGTKYYPVGCAGADKISAQNKIWFVTAEAATAAGYTPAANCKGL